MIIILIIEFAALAIIGLLQEFVYPGIGSLIVSMFSLIFLFFSIGELKGKDAKRLSDRDL